MLYTVAFCQLFIKDDDDEAVFIWYRNVTDRRTDIRNCYINTRVGVLTRDKN